MRVKTLLCLPYQFAVETLLAPARFISRYKQNRRTPAIKGEGHSPFTICRTESQFFHVRVSRSFQRVNPWPTQLRSKLFQNNRKRQNLCPHILVQRLKFRFEFIRHLNGPFHTYKYGIKYIM